MLLDELIEYVAHLRGQIAINEAAKDRLVGVDNNRSGPRKLLSCWNRDGLIKPKPSMRFDHADDHVHVIVLTDPDMAHRLLFPPQDFESLAVANQNALSKQRIATNLRDELG